MRTIVAFVFMALLCCPSLQAGDGEEMGFDFSKEFEEEQARARQEEREQQGMQTQEQMETKYLRSLEKLISFDRLIVKDGFTLTTSDKMVQQNILLKELLDSTSRRAVKRTENSGQERPLVVDERFQQILGTYINSIDSTVNFMRRVSTDHQQLRNSIEVFNGNVGKIAEELNIDQNSILIMTIEDWNIQASNFVAQYNQNPSTKVYQDLYQYSMAAFSDKGYRGDYGLLFARDGRYLTTGRFSPSTSSKIRVADGLRNTLVEKKSEFTEIDNRFKTNLEQWKKFSFWMADQNKLVSGGAWKLAADMIAVSADEMYATLNNHYAEYQKNYKIIYTEGPVHNVMSPDDDKDTFQNGLEETWKQLRIAMQKAFQYYQGGVTTVQRIRADRR
ncbi:MAG: hypothetical protein Q4G66_05730 [bacterium]|nr:hypothetical protein [bacterium]